MTDKDLEDKFSAQAETHYQKDGVRALIDTCWHLDALDDVKTIGRLLVPH